MQTCRKFTAKLTNWCWILTPVNYKYLYSFSVAAAIYPSTAVWSLHNHCHSLAHFRPRTIRHLALGLQRLLLLLWRRLKFPCSLHFFKTDLLIYEFLFLPTFRPILSIYILFLHLKCKTRKRQVDLCCHFNLRLVMFWFRGRKYETFVQDQT